MKYLGTALSSAVLAVAAAPVFAQATSNAPATPANPPPFGYGPMWGYGYHHMGGWGFGHVLGIILVVLLIVWLVRLFRFGGHHGWRYRHAGYGYGHGSSALDILEERFAKGEIDKTEFEEKRKLLMR